MQQLHKQIGDTVDLQVHNARPVKGAATSQLLRAE
jgi:hypothetical protein